MNRSIRGSFFMGSERVLQRMFQILGFRCRVQERMIVLLSA